MEKTLSSLEKGTVGQRLLWARRQLAKNQAEIAQELGVALKTYQRYERDEQQFPVSLMQRLRDRLGVLPLWLIHGTGEPWVDEEHTPEHLRQQKRSTAISAERAGERVAAALAPLRWRLPRAALEVVQCNLALLTRLYGITPEDLDLARAAIEAAAEAEAAHSRGFDRTSTSVHKQQSVGAVNDELLAGCIAALEERAEYRRLNPMLRARAISALYVLCGENRRAPADMADDALRSAV